MSKKTLGRAASPVLTAARGLSSLCVCALLAVAAPGLAYASVPQPGVVSDNPADTTPNLVSDGSGRTTAAYAIEEGGADNLMYVGGQFTKVSGPGQQSAPVTRTYIAAFNKFTGVISTSFDPVLNGDVWAIGYVASSNSVYVAGDFTSVNGTARQGLAKLDAATGEVDLNFSPPWTSGSVSDLQVTGGRVVVGGHFPGYLLALNPTTGANTHYISAGIGGNNGGKTGVYRFAVSPDGSKLVAIGDFLAPHSRAFMLDLGATSAALDPWYYSNFQNDCSLPKTYPAYLRDVAFDPTSTYFVIVATGYVVSDPSRRGFDVCDAAAKFSVVDKNPYKPLWVNYTGGDTLHSVAVDAGAVYVQGHNRWLDNPTGRDSCPTGSGCVSRPGIGAIDPTTGKALAWNPTKARGVGGKDLLLTSQGLWVMSDTKKIGGEYHFGVALMPY